MLEALIVTLREGVEAALVVGIIVVFLRREGLERHLGAVWSGIGAALVGSLLGAVALYRWAVNQEAFEGVLYVASAVVVASMAVWMWRHAPAVAGEMKGALGRIVGRERDGAVWLGLFVFTFLMVVREGIETVLFLAAVSLSTSGLLALLGAALGLAAAVVFGVFFVRGSLRVDLRRFFAVTGIALIVLVVQLLLNGYHELSEAGWLPASERSMALVGPLVRNDFFFIAAVVILPLLLLLVPSTPAAAAAPANPAQARLQTAEGRRLRLARTVGGLLGITIVGILGLGFVYGQQPETLPAATPVPVDADGVRLPAAPLADGRLHRYVADLGGRSVRFFAVATGESSGRIATAFDACEICGTQGYVAAGSEIVCRHCGSAIYAPTIGQTGGCNPIALPSRVEGDALRIARADLERGAPLFD